MSKIAFMFPGQGSFEAGMGKDVAEAIPEAMKVYDDGSEASGLDLKALCFDSPVEALMDTEVQQPALVATSLAFDAALRTRGISPDFVVGHSVGEFAALGAARALAARDAIALVRERGLAMAATARENPGSMAAILGLADEAVERVAGELQLPGPARHLRRDVVGRRGMRRGRA
jgi:[acyl-carrier-protein] S-malonyltransferase